MLPDRINLVVVGCCDSQISVYPVEVTPVLHGGHLGMFLTSNEDSSSRCANIGTEKCSTAKSRDLGEM